MRRWKKIMISCFVIGIVWSLGTTCMAREKQSEDRIDQIEYLEDRIEEELAKGSSSFTIYVNKEIEEEELQEVNQNLDGFYGYVDRYSQWSFPFITYYKTVFYLNNSDNYYVLAALTGDYSFTEDQRKAKQLAAQVEEIQNAIMEEGMTEDKKVKAVHDYLIDHTSYMEQEEESGEGSDEYTAYGVLMNHEGVCSGYTQAFQLFMKLNGIENKIVLGEADGVSHSWNLIFLDGDWYHVDTTWDDPVPDEENRHVYAYYNVTDEDMEASHSWKKEDYPKAEGTKYNYYVQNGYVIENQEEFIKFAREKIEKEEPVIHCLIENYKEEDYNRELFQQIMNGTKARSLNFQAYGEGSKKAFRLVPEYERRSNE